MKEYSVELVVSTSDGAEISFNDYFPNNKSREEWIIHKESEALSDYYNKRIKLKSYHLDNKNASKYLQASEINDTIHIVRTQGGITKGCEL